MNKSEHNEERINHIIQMLNEMDVDGETMEYIINQVGMEQQMLKQLVIKMPIEWTIRLLFEKVNLPQ
jgi:hypothetical protein